MARSRDRSRSVWVSCSRRASPPACCWATRPPTSRSKARFWRGSSTVRTWGSPSACWWACRPSRTARSSRRCSRSGAALPAAAFENCARRRRSGTSRRSCSRACPGACITCFAERWTRSTPRLLPGRLAGRAAAGANRARADPAGARRALAHTPVLSRSGFAVDRGSRLAVDVRRGAAGDGVLRGDADQDLEQRAHRTSSAGTGKAVARRQDRGARQPDQPALPVQHADLHLVADPDAAGNGADADHEAVGPASPPAARHRSLRHAARRTGVDRRVPRHRSRALRTAAAGRQTDQPRDARRDRAEHAAAAAGRELDQTRAVAEGGRRTNHDPQPDAGRPRRHRGPRRRAGHDRRAPRERPRRRHRPEQRQRASADDLRCGVSPEAHQQRPARARARAWKSRN